MNANFRKMSFLDAICLSPKVTIRKGEDIPFVEMANVAVGNRKDPMAIEVRSFSGGTKFEKNDTVIASIEPCLQHGKSFYFSEHDKGAGSTEFLVFRKIDGVTTDQFVYYFMMSYEIRAAMIRSMKGATGRQRVDTEVFTGMQINVPDIETQDRIAGILSDYDSAIANCRKQIALLEEAAMRLYREWFKDGKGEKKRIGDFVECTIAGSWGTGEVSPKCPNKVVCIRGADFEDIGQRGLGKKIIRYVSDKHMAERSLNEGDMIVEMSGGSPTQATGRNVLMTGQLIQRFGLPVLCTNFCKLIRPEKGYGFYLYLAWKDLYESKVMFNYEVGTTGIKNFDYELFTHDVLITDPGKKIDAFNQVVSPMFDMIDACGTTIADCAEARDRLLPKLMKGEVTV